MAVVIGIIVMIATAIWTIVCGAFWALFIFILWCVILPSLFLIEKYGIINVVVSYVLILSGVVVLARIIKKSK
ncbi:hypothetical protein L8V77_05020 [Campylobacter sp. IFREMER_LSEM_CL2127]|uniref:hypothetical protein n=1 Tax=Campylobacter TaxID=194 RepID=UPI00057D2831|nr:MULTISPECIES: hypothetical protein [Campylobacter]AJD05591.1 hypothetical protein UPTC16712_0041 [Campylobacter lari RM16712]MBT0827506.1 hypothetical protein [Campylobacter lari]MCR6518651.1 hypothetical protein [Campylobacter lari]MCR6776596.1 hypothetical protein [Campylobacter lari]MCV3381743.1 hypothetical protein [Campylobacter sp. IFREMER_LSEM_CL2127]